MRAVLMLTQLVEVGQTSGPRRTLQKVPWTPTVVVLCLLLAFGCSEQGFVLELHLAEVRDSLEIVLDRDAGVTPKLRRRDANRVVALYFDRDGRCVIDADWPITMFHQTVVVLPNGKRLREWRDFRVVDSNWIMNRVQMRIGPRAVQSQTVLDGSRYKMRLRFNDNPQEGREQGGESH